MHCRRTCLSTYNLVFFEDAVDEKRRRYVLDQILSGEAAETVVERIHEYLAEIGENVRAGKIMLDEFIIFKASNVHLLMSRALTTETAAW